SAAIVLPDTLACFTFTGSPVGFSGTTRTKRVQEPPRAPPSTVTWSIPSATSSGPSARGSFPLERAKIVQVRFAAAVDQRDVINGRWPFASDWLTAPAVGTWTSPVVSSRSQKTVLGPSGIGAKLPSTPTIPSTPAPSRP